MIEFFGGLSMGIYVAAIIIAFIALISQMSLYAKAGQPAVAALVPVWNVIIFCKVLGRPALHSLWLIVPGLVIATIIAVDWTLFDGLFPIHGQGGELEPGPTEWSQVTVPFILIGAAMIPLIYIVIVMFTEVCDSFGKHSTADKVMCVCFNGAYILFVLGISDAKYESPWWARKRGLPYYMPDFKHKGKKYLVTPDGPIIGDPRDQKVKIEIVDEEVAASVDATTAVKEHITSLPKTDTKPENKSKDDKPVTAKVEEKTKDSIKTIDKKVDSSSKKVETTAKKSIPKKSDPKPAADGTKKTWREEMAEKYKKK